ncbi:hypothetical protein [Anaerocolumna jejuensis]|uniref:hypothetical protein n=1 Tax=Anaerocolumna jejuensis TaxID=259063 RepID=UPI003F7CCB70
MSENPNIEYEILTQEIYQRRIQRVLKTLPDDLKEQSKESCYTLSSRNPGTKGLLATSGIFSDRSWHVKIVILMQHCVTESKK